MTDSTRVDGKRVLVTGGSSGIGAGIARAMSEAGGHVAVVGRDAARLDAVARETGGVAIRGDLTAAGEPARIAAEAVAALGGLDVLVHAAGIFLVGPLEEHTVELLDRQLDVNVRAPYALTLAALPHLGRGSSVIFLSSVAGQIGFPGAAAYCMSKGAVEQMIKAFAVELAPKGIRVNGIAPGNVRTAMNEDLLANPDYEAAMIAMTPLRSIGEVGEIAPLAVLMASPAGGFMAGASFLVDGGLGAQ